MRRPDVMARLPEPYPMHGASVIAALNSQHHPEYFPFRLLARQVGLPLTQFFFGLVRFIRLVMLLGQSFSVEANESGNVTLVHRSGSVVRFTTEGDIQLFAHRDIDWRSGRWTMYNSDPEKVADYVRKHYGEPHNG